MSYREDDYDQHVADEVDVMYRGQIHVEWFGTDEHGKPRMDPYGNPVVRSGAVYSYQWGSGRIEVDRGVDEDEVYVFHPSLSAGVLVFSEDDAKAIITALHCAAS